MHNIIFVGVCTNVSDETFVCFMIGEEHAREKQSLMRGKGPKVRIIRKQRGLEL